MLDEVYTLPISPEVFYKFIVTAGVVLVYLNQC